MENRKKLNLFVLIINALLTAVSIYLLLAALIESDSNILQNIEIIADLVACSIALFYLIDGYSKGLAKRYQLFLIVTAINALAVAVLSIGEKTPMISVVMCSIAFVILLVLSFYKNLGKTISYILCTILLFIRLSGLLSNVLILSNQMPALNFALFVSQISLALLVFVSTYAKYTDKASRQTN